MVDETTVERRQAQGCGCERTRGAGPFRDGDDEPGRPGVQSACWDLRVTPNPAPPPAEGRGRGEGAEPNAQQSVSPFGAACQAASASGTPALYGPPPVYLGPFVSAGTYHVALVVDGKTVDT